MIKSQFVEVKYSQCALVVSDEHHKSFKIVRGNPVLVQHLPNNNEKNKPRKQNAYLLNSFERHFSVVKVFSDTDAQKQLNQRKQKNEYSSLEYLGVMTNKSVLKQQPHVQQDKQGRIDQEQHACEGFTA